MSNSYLQSQLCCLGDLPHLTMSEGNFSTNKPWTTPKTRLFLDPGLSECPPISKYFYDGDGIPYFQVQPSPTETPIELYINYHGAESCVETGAPATHCPIWASIWRSGFVPMGHPDWEPQITSFVAYSFRPFAVTVTTTPPSNGWSRRGGYRLTLGKGGKPPAQGRIELGLSGYCGAFYEYYQSCMADALGYPHDPLTYPGYHEGCFDTDYIESATPNPGGIFPIAVHEPGHGVGLWHSTAPTIMGWDGIQKPSSWYKPEWTTFQWSPRQVAWILSWVGPSEWTINLATAYHLNLMRPIDLLGLLSWHQLGTSISHALVGQFGISQDEIRRNISLTPEAISHRIDVARWSYKLLLGRAPSPTELEFCSRCTAQEILNIAVSSVEYGNRGDKIRNLYRAVLGREVDDLSYKNAVRLVQSYNISPLLDIVLKSREFAYRGLIY